MCSAEQMAEAVALFAKPASGMYYTVTER